MICILSKREKWLLNLINDSRLRKIRFRKAERASEKMSKRESKIDISDLALDDFSWQSQNP